MYTWIAETFGLADGLARGIAFALALGIVLVLIALFIFILKRLTETRLSTGRGRQPRIAVMDATNIDTRRRLLLIRRDNVEHLILVGGPSDIVVEQGIIKNAPLTAGSPKHHTAPASLMSSAPGYEVAGVAAEPILSELEQIAEQTAQRKTPPVSPTPQQAPARAQQQPQGEAPTQRRSAPEIPEPRVRSASLHRPPAEHTRTANATNAERKKGGSKLNPAKSILEAAAARRISSAFTTRKADTEAPAVKGPPAHTSQPAPLVEPQHSRQETPVPAQRPIQTAQVSNGAFTDSRQENAQVANYARDLASATDLNAAHSDATAPTTENASSVQPPKPRHEVRAELRSELRQVTHPSAGPAATARTAFMKQPAKQDAAAETGPRPANVSVQEPAPTNVEVLNPNPVQPDRPGKSLTEQVGDIASRPSDNGSKDKTSSEPISLASVMTEPPSEVDIFDDTPSTAPEVTIQSSPSESPAVEAIKPPPSAEEMPNPIEDEMTKLLGEINGPAKQ
ncbi:hypothetical protein [Roseibium algae]|uniref:Flagellar biosynthesis protein FliO n=1 Tax=Roseibium algae TaxID=3123038 RepID=A0ABU8TMP2_9HYPH